jgi:hypothetical protein
MPKKAVAGIVKAAQWLVLIRELACGESLHTHGRVERAAILPGIVEPIRAGVGGPKLGLGKQEQDDFYTAEENIQRKKLEVEVEETEEIARQREVSQTFFLLCSNSSKPNVLDCCTSSHSLHATKESVDLAMQRSLQWGD